MSKTNRDQVHIKCEGKNKDGKVVSVNKTYLLDDLNISEVKSSDVQALVSEIWSNNELSYDEKLLAAQDCLQKAAVQSSEKGNPRLRMLSSVASKLEEEGISININDLTFAEEVVDQGILYKIYPEAAYGF